MDFEIPKTLYSGNIKEITLGKGDKAVTVGGKIFGTTTRPLGDIDYTYPLIYAREVHIVGPKSTSPVFFSIGVGAYTGF